jgi:pimeloyl-ACP methyl ester carboxylesterase
VSGGNPNADNLLVFVHGFPEFWYAWRHQLQHFLQRPNYL